MALITLAELLTVKPEADQLSLCALPTMRGAGSFNHGWVGRRREGRGGGGGVTQ